MNKEEMQALRIEATRELLRRRFYRFFLYFWDAVNNTPLVENWHLEYLCDEAQKVVDRVVRREPKQYDLIVNVSPGTSKSNIFSVMLNAWAWTLDPSLQFLTGSHAAPLAISLAVKCRDIIKSSKYQELFPGVELRKDIDAKQWYQTTAGGARYTCSTEGSPIGRHAHLIVIDDPIDPKRALSVSEREATNQWFDNTLATRKVDAQITAMILVMQRLNEEDPTGYLLKKNPGAYKHICLPAELCEALCPKELEEKYQDGLFDAKRLPRNVLYEKKIDMGQFNYAGQYSQSPVPDDGGLFDVTKFKLTKVLPDRIVKTVRSWDKAGTEGGGCRTAGVKLAELKNGSYIVLDSVIGQWQAEKREATIRQTADLDGKSVKIVIEQEGGSGGKESAEATVKNLSGFTVFCDRPSGNKALRAEPFATQVNIGNVYIMEGLWNKEFLDELHYFPRGKYKDQVDAASQGFAKLTSSKKTNYIEMVAEENSERPKTNTDKIMEHFEAIKTHIKYIEENGVKIPN